MKKQKLTATEKRILKNGPNFGQLIAEVMYHDQCCENNAMLRIGIFFINHLADKNKNKNQIIKLLRCMITEISKRKAAPKRRTRKSK